VKPYLLDTNICIYALKGLHPPIRERMESLEPSDVWISSIVVAELFTGAQKSRHRQRTLEIVHRFLEPFRVAVFDESAARHYGRIRADLEMAGKGIGPNDLIVAATTLAVEATLVTHNAREFSRVPGLRCEDWTLPKGS
jgi:tRNA(fMet)-specific endonuclease VapC